MTLVRHWNRLSRETVNSSVLKILRMGLDKPLSSLTYIGWGTWPTFALLWVGFWTPRHLGSLLTEIILRFYDTVLKRLSVLPWWPYSKWNTYINKLTLFDLFLRADWRKLQDFSNPLSTKVETCIFTNRILIFFSRIFFLCYLNFNVVLQCIYNVFLQIQFSTQINIYLK